MSGVAHAVRERRSLARRLELASRKSYVPPGAAFSPLENGRRSDAPRNPKTLPKRLAETAGRRGEHARVRKSLLAVARRVRSCVARAHASRRDSRCGVFDPAITWIFAGEPRCCATRDSQLPTSASLRADALSRRSSESSRCLAQSLFSWALGDALAWFERARQRDQQTARPVRGRGPVRRRTALPGGARRLSSRSFRGWPPPRSGA